MKQMILKKIQIKEVKRPCRGCVFGNVDVVEYPGCYAPNKKAVLDDPCFINEKKYIWVFDKIKGKDE